jgi:hypothetical protein
MPRYGNLKIDEDFLVFAPLSAFASTNKKTVRDFSNFLLIKHFQLQHLLVKINKNKKLSR